MTMGQYLEANNGQPPKTEGEWNKWYDKNVFLKDVTAKTGEMFTKDGKVYKVTGAKDGLKTYSEIKEPTAAEIVENPWSDNLTNFLRVPGYSGSQDIVDARIKALTNGEGVPTGTVLDRTTFAALTKDSRVKPLNITVPFKTQVGGGWEINKAYNIKIGSNSAFIMPLGRHTKDGSGFIQFLDLQTGEVWNQYNPETTAVATWNHKFKDDGYVFDPGSGVMVPSKIK
jgi:hypothetical protein